MMKTRSRPFEPLETDPSPPAASFEATFPVANARYNDWWAAVLFVAAVIAEVVITALALRGYARARGTAGKGIYDGDGNEFGLSTNAMILFILVAGVAAVLGLGHLLLTQRFAKKTIWASGILRYISHRNVHDKYVNNCMTVRLRALHRVATTSTSGTALSASSASFLRSGMRGVSGRGDRTSPLPL